MPSIKPRDILLSANNTISGLTNQVVDLIEIIKPTSTLYALQLTKIVSKLSPMLGNLFEFRVVDALNSKNTIYKGKWVRQDPGFPDARFESEDYPDKNIGVEIKAWFPFATEITGRFKDSEDIFIEDTIDVALIAWLPEFVFWGKPVVLKTLVVSGKSVAEARDKHYHNPPHYIVFEPEDTAERTGNLQQTNTNGYVFQDEDKRPELYKKAVADVRSWGATGGTYSTSKEYQGKLKELQGKYPYRLDTNYAKIDRIEHSGIEAFKTAVLEMPYKGRKVKEWAKLASKDITDKELIRAIQELLK